MIDTHSLAEKRQKKRQQANIYHVTEDPNKPKYYVLDMFPYPSGMGLHVGHPKGYIATDIIARKKMLEGYNVLHPIGWDAFGLPAENYAIKNKVNPNISTAQNIEMFKQQLEQIGLTYDRSREINTTEPNYYKRTQRIFTQLYNHYYDHTENKAKPVSQYPTQPIPDKERLAYVDYKPINRCPTCKTGLANEDLQDGRCERCDSEVEQKPMRQWVLKITDYAERLLTGLDTLDQRPEYIKDMQRNWIGKSEGVIVTFHIQRRAVAVSEEYTRIKVFTTRIDTIFGTTFLVMAPENDTVLKITTPDRIAEVQAYIERVKHMTPLQRMSSKEKTGVFTGTYAINPATLQSIPVWVADYVLVNYGEGAIMAVPAHDQRDFAFAQTFNLPIRQVIAPYPASEDFSLPFEDTGVLFDSADFTGLATAQAKEKILTRLGEKVAQKKISYRLQDRVFSRQRYRGEPIPMVHTQDGGIVSLSDDQLPLVLPDVEHYEPTGTEEGPLAGIDSWMDVTLPDGSVGRRESNTMPQRAGSSRYWLRYMDPRNDDMLVDPIKEKYRGQVDLYVGGVEHATRHLIYGRFWYKFLYDIGVVSFDEPFTRLQKVGLVMGEDNRKMSKRRGNVVNPTDVIKEYGPDALRVYEMFMGPFDAEIARSTAGVKGAKKFLDKIAVLVDKCVDNDPDVGKYESLVHQTIKKVTEDIDAMKYNTAISQMMILVNTLTDVSQVQKNLFADLVIILSPFAPHLAEELWEKLGNPFSIFTQAKRPSFDPAKLVSDTVTLAVQFNGKMRGTLEVAKDASQDDVMLLVQGDAKLITYLTGEPKKIIYVPGKICNVII